MEPNTSKEIDISSKVSYFIKFGLIGLLVIGAVIGGIIWTMKSGSRELVVNDAKVASNLVGVRTTAGGTITELLVQDGEQVEAGTVVARIKVNITDEQIKQLEQNVELSQRNLEQIMKGTTVTVPVQSAPVVSGGGGNVAAAQQRYDRMKQLFEMGAISASERDAAAADLAAAQAAGPSVSGGGVTYETRVQPSSLEAIKSAELALKQAQMALQAAKSSTQATEIITNVAGTVFLGDVQVDSEVKPGQVIMNVGEADSLWVEAYLPMEKQDVARLGQLVNYKIDGKKYKGTVTDIVVPDSDNGEQQGATEGAAENAEQESEAPKKITVKISIPVEALAGMRPEQRVEVTFE